MTTPNQPIQNFPDFYGVGAYEVGNADGNYYGQGVTEEWARSLFEFKPFNAGNAVSRLREELGKLSLEELQRWSEFIPGNFETIANAIDTITDALDPDNISVTFTEMRIWWDSMLGNGGDNMATDPSCSNYAYWREDMAAGYLEVTDELANIFSRGKALKITMPDPKPAEDINISVVRTMSGGPQAIPLTLDTKFYLEAQVRGDVSNTGANYASVLIKFSDSHGVEPDVWEWAPYITPIGVGFQQIALAAEVPAGAYDTVEGFIGFAVGSADPGDHIYVDQILFRTSTWFDKLIADMTGIAGALTSDVLNFFNNVEAWAGSPGFFTDGAFTPVQAVHSFINDVLLPTQLVPAVRDLLDVDGDGKLLDDLIPQFVQDAVANVATNTTSIIQVLSETKGIREKITGIADATETDLDDWIGELARKQAYSYRALKRGKNMVPDPEFMDPLWPSKFGGGHAIEQIGPGVGRRTLKFNQQATPTWSGLNFIVDEDITPEYTPVVPTQKFQAAIEVYVPSSNTYADSASIVQFFFEWRDSTGVENGGSTYQWTTNDSEYTRYVARNLSQLTQDAWNLLEIETDVPAGYDTMTVRFQMRPNVDFGSGFNLYAPIVVDTTDRYTAIERFRDRLTNIVNSTESDFDNFLADLFFRTDALDNDATIKDVLIPPGIQRVADAIDLDGDGYIVDTFLPDWILPKKFRDDQGISGADNLLWNGGFEDVDNYDKPEFDAGRFAYSDIQKRNGSRSLECINVNGVTQYYELFMGEDNTTRQYIPCKPGDRFRITAWARLDVGNTQKSRTTKDFGFGLWEYDDTPTYLTWVGKTFSQSECSDSAWTELTQEVEITSPTAVSFLARFYANGSGAEGEKVYIDSVVVKQVEELSDTVVDGSGKFLESRMPQSIGDFFDLMIDGKIDGNYIPQFLERKGQSTENLLEGCTGDWSAHPLTLYNNAEIDSDALKLNFQSGTGARFGPVRVTPGDEYTFRYKAWCSASFDGTSSDSKIRIATMHDNANLPGDGTHIASLNYVNYGRDTWIDIEQTFTIPAGCDQVGLRFKETASVGQVWIDDVEFFRVIPDRFLRRILDVDNDGKIIDTFVPDFITNLIAPDSNSGEWVDFKADPGGTINTQNVVKTIEPWQLPKIPVHNLTAERQNLLHDGSFNSADSIYNASGNMGYDATEGNTSLGCAKATGNGSTYSRTMGNMVPVTPGEVIGYSGHMKTSGYSGSNGTFMKLYYYEDGVYVVGAPVTYPNPGANDDWTEVTHPTHVVPDDVNEVSLGIVVNASSTAGDVWFDDLWLWKEAPSSQTLDVDPIDDTSKDIVDKSTIASGGGLFSNMRDHLRDVVRKFFPGSGDDEPNELEGAAEAMASIQNTLQVNTGKLGALQAAANSNGQSMVVDFTSMANMDYDDAAFPFTMTETGSGNGYIHVVNGTCEWVDATNNADSEWVGVYDGGAGTSITDTTDQKLDATVGGIPGWSGGESGLISGIVRCNAAGTRYVYATGYRAGLFGTGFRAELGCVVDGTTYVWETDVKANYNFNLSIVAGYDGDDDRYLVYSGNDIVIDYDDSAHDSDFTAYSTHNDYRYWGFSVETQDDGDATPPPATFVAVYDHNLNP